MDRNVTLGELASRGRTTYEQHSAVLQDLIEKLGKPTSEKAVQLENGFGATWTAHFYEWILSDVYWQLVTDPSLETCIPSHIGGEWTVEAETLAEHERDLAAERATHGALEK